MGLAVLYVSPDGIKVIPLKVDDAGRLILVGTTESSSTIPLKVDDEGRLIPVGKKRDNTYRTIAVGNVGEVLVGGRQPDWEYAPLYVSEDGSLVVGGFDSNGNPVGLRLDGVGNLRVIQHSMDYSGNLKFGIKDIVSFSVDVTATSNGTLTVIGPTVPTGEFWVLTNLHVSTDEPNDPIADVVLVSHYGEHYVFRRRLINIYESYHVSGTIYLSPDDYIRATFTTISAGRKVHLMGQGYKIKI